MTKFSGYQIFQVLLTTGNGTRTTVTETEMIQTTITVSAVSNTVGIGEKRAYALFFLSPKIFLPFRYLQGKTGFVVEDKIIYPLTFADGTMSEGCRMSAVR